MSAPQYPGQQGPYGQPMQYAGPPKKKMSGCLVAVIVLVVVAVPVLGITSALAIYGVRKYLASAKAAEAKNSVGAIARAAGSHYEVGKVLCGSAVAVPTTVPKAVKYRPGPADYESGNETTGWKCLRFSMTTPVYYQYQYHAGSGYVTPAGATAGAHGFEAAAIGDLNGDGVHSHFARTGTIDASGALQISQQLYIDNEFE